MKNYKLSEGSSITLDIIRVISAQLVVIGHGISFFQIFKSFHQPNFPWIQNIAVLVFFILSGYLISYSTIRKKITLANYSFTQYFIERFSRIYTAFIPSLVFVALICYYSKVINPNEDIFNNSLNLKSFIGNFFMLQDFPLVYIIESDIMKTFGSASPFWTLAVEWWIYMFFGYLFLTIFDAKKVSFKKIIFLSILSIVPLFNTYNGRGEGLTVYWIFGLLIFIIDSQNYLDLINRKFKLITLSILILLACLRVKRTMVEYEPVFAFLIAFIILLTINLTRKIVFKEYFVKIVRFTANYSYSLYLIHYSVLDFLFREYYGKQNPYLLLVLGFVISNIISAIIGYYCEIKLTKKIKDILLKKYVPSLK